VALRPYLELVRLPAVFTAPADVLAGAALAAVFGRPASPGAIALLVLASAAIYCAGMAANDLCDLEVDRRERPRRPLPSGRVSLRAAWTLVLSLQALGLGLAALVGRDALLAVAATIAATWIYNAVLKGGALGPTAMGVCRYGNAVVGLAASGAVPLAPLAFAIPAGTLAFTAAVTEVSRHEAAGATRRQVAPRAAALLGLSLVPAVWPLAGLLPVPWAAALVLAPLAWLYRPAARAVAAPSPGAVRGLVMAGIFGIAIVNGVIAAAAGGFVAAAVAVGLLVPGRAFGRWFYAT
jgi:4-hydroxybenzoate polyprenyltransferase